MGKVSKKIAHEIQEKRKAVQKVFKNVAAREEAEIPVTEHDFPNPPFTAEMKKDYTILVPQMLPIHFSLMKGILEDVGYHLEILENTEYSVVNEGLKSVHNDTCYPALLAIGQLLDALKSGKYDLNKTAVLISQTGGGCRASNYLYLLKKAMEKNNLGHIPVIPLNLSKLDGAGGLELSTKTLIKVLYACFYADMILWLRNQCEAYEVTKGETEKTVEILIKQMTEILTKGKHLQLKKNYFIILGAFKGIERKKEEKIKVGIVGEIYMKYSPLGNNKLAEYLISEGAEPVVTGVMDFLLYSLNNVFVDAKLYKNWDSSLILKKAAFQQIVSCQEKMVKVIEKYSDFNPPSTFTDVQKAVDGYISEGVKMGEGWLLTGEMVEFIQTGVNNIISAQPFGCLPNHIVAKGMIRAVKTRYPDANIVAIDYDPGASKTNQENRIKLMIATATAIMNGQTEHHVIKLQEEMV